jgi:hypothetical protein
MIDILSSARLPKLFKRANVIAISKPGKDGSDPAYYRPISLLSVISLGHQAGLRKHRSYTEQVMEFITHIETGFQRQPKTGVLFVDLSATYDTLTLCGKTDLC